MKRFMFITMLASFGLLLAQDAAGTYKLTGTNVRYTNLARQTTVASIADSYGLGVSLPVASIPINTGFFQLLNGPFNEDNLELGGAFLNVTFKKAPPNSRLSSLNGPFRSWKKPLLFGIIDTGVFTPNP